MNRRGFLASLIALPAGLVAAAKACAKPKPSRFVWEIDWSDIEIKEGCACTLTSMRTTQLTPKDIEEMGKIEKRWLITANPSDYDPKPKWTRIG